MPGADAALPLPGTGGCLLLSCSPRKGGNSDGAARLFAEGRSSVALTGEAVVPVAPLFLRDYAIAPCTGCGTCERYARKLAKQGENEPALPFGCPLAGHDDSRSMLGALLGCGELCLVAPVYFYHLPAMFKAFVDRLQPLWALREAGFELFRPGSRVCRLILLGARPRGERLFAGSLLTLQYALSPLGFTLAEPLLLYGVEKPGDVLMPEIRRRVIDYGQESARGC